MAETDVIQHPEFVRFFFDLFRRVGGTDALSNEELLELINALDDAAVRLDALGSITGDLRAALQALQAGEMVMQRAGGDAILPDVMQAGSVDVLASEMTCQI